MDTSQKVVLIAHTIIAVMIIVLVLLQRGKGADAGAAFGAGASGTVFGSRGTSNFFSRATAVLATVFFASSLLLAYMSSDRAERRPDSLLDRVPAMESDEAPATEFSDDPSLDIPEFGPEPGAGPGDEVSRPLEDLPPFEPEDGGADPGN